MKVKSFMLILCMLLPTGAATSFAQNGNCGADGANLTWSISGGTLTVSGTGAMADYSGDNAPWYSYKSSIATVVIEAGATSIGKEAFYDCTALTSVTIGDGVKSIGEGAFHYCSSLLSVIVPNGVTNIGYDAFAETGLTSVTIGKSVTSIGDYAFAGCAGLTIVTNLNPAPQSIASVVFSDVEISKLTLLVPVESVSLYNDASVWNGFGRIDPLGVCGENLTWTLSAGVLIISGTGEMTDFASKNNVPWYSSYRDSITTIVIEAGATSIGNYAFNGSNRLSSVTIPASVINIGSWVFSGCGSLTGIYVDSVNPLYSSSLDSVLFNKDKTELIVCPEGKSGNYTIPASVTRIRNYAFADCSGLTSITNLNPAPQEIENEVFAFEISDRTLYVPVEAVNLYKSAPVWNGFGRIDPSGACGDSLTWTLSYGELIIRGTGEMEDYSSSDDVSWSSYRDSITTVVIGNDVKSIGRNAFALCNNLDSVTIPENVTSIGNRAFYRCAGLTSVAIGSNVREIGSEAFYRCTGLTSVTIPEKVTYILNSAFSYCTGLTSVTIPTSVESIGNYAFSYCTGLTSVTNLRLAPQNVNNNVFYSVTLENLTLYLPVEAANLYKDAPVWKDFGTIAPFGACGADLAWLLEKGKLTVDGTGAMTDYSISDRAPWSSYRDSIRTVEIGNGVTKIGSEAFSGCDSLTAVALGDSVTDIKNSSFYGCRSLDSIHIPSGVRYIGSYAFYGAGLDSVTIPASVTGIEDGAFSGCSDLTGIYVDSENTAYYSDTAGVLFSKDSLILVIYPGGRNGDYTIPASVSNIEDYAFAGCAGLTAVTIPENLTRIGDYAFAGCSGLDSITNLNARPQSIDNTVFDGVTLSDIVLYVPLGSIILGAYNTADIWKDFGTTLPLYPSGVCGDNLIWSISLDWALTIEGAGAMPDYFSPVDVPWNLYRPFITSVAIGDSITNIGNMAFSDCSSLTSVTIPASVTNIGSRVFYGCSSLTGIYVDSANVNYSSSLDGVLFSKDGTQLIAYPGGKIGDYTIPKNVTSIRDYAFYAANLTSVTNLNPTPQTINNSVFSNVQTGSLSLFVPVESVAAYKNAAGWSGFGIFNPLGACGENLTWVLLDGVLTVSGTGTMANYHYIDSVAAPWSSYRDSITTIVIEAGVTSIGEYAFYLCNQVTSITIGSDVDSIKGYAISFCSKLTSITIPASVTRIRNYAFASCTALSSVINLNPEPQIIDRNVFNVLNINNISLSVPAGSAERYRNALVWRDFKPAVETDIPAVGAPSVQVYLRGQTLHVDSPVAERIDVYSVTGTLLYKLEKPAGDASLIINRSGRILIVNGSSGWVRKITNY